MATLGQLYKQEGSNITTKKTYMVPFEDLYIDVDNNIREVDLSHAATFRDMWLAGIQPDPLLVEIMSDGRIRIADGQHRYVGGEMARDLGLDLKRVECKDFVGSEVDRYEMMFKRAQGKQLLPLQVAKACRVMESCGLKRKEIAEKLGVSVSYVQTHMELNDVGNELKDMVKDGQMSYATAVDIQREHGLNAGEKANELLQEAQESGKKKITKKVIDKKKYGNKEGKRLAELLSDAAPVVQGGNDYLMLRNGVKDEVMQLIKNYLEDGEGK